MNFWKNNWYSVGLILFMTVIMSFVVQSNPWSLVLPRHDSSMFMYYGFAMLDGRIPYTEIFDHKGPILFLVEYFGALLSPKGSFLGFWLLEILAWLSSFTFLYLTAKRIVGVNKALICLLSIIPFSIWSIQGGNLSEEFALPFISYALWWFTHYATKKEKDNWIYATSLGITGALVFFMRANMVSVWFVIGIYVIFVNAQAHTYRKLIVWISQVIIGGLAVTIPLITYGFLHGNLREAFYQSFILNSQYSSQVQGGKLSTFTYFMNHSLETIVGIVFVAFIVKFIIEIFDKNFSVYYLMIILYALINWYTVIMSGNPFDHYSMTLIPIFLISAVLLINDIPLNFKQLLILQISLIIIIIFTGIQSVKTSIHRIDGRTNTEKRFANYIANHGEGDIYVHNIDANIYNLSQRYSNSRFYVLPMLEYNKHNDLSEEFMMSFKNNKPQFIVTADLKNDWRFNHFLRKVIRSDYKLCQYENGMYLYEKRN